MLGAVTFFLPEVLGGGYKWIQSVIDGQLALGLIEHSFLERLLLLLIQ